MYSNTVQTYCYELPQMLINKEFHVDMGNVYIEHHISEKFKLILNHFISLELSKLPCM